VRNGAHTFWFGFYQVFISPPLPLYRRPPRRLPFFPRACSQYLYRRRHRERPAKRVLGRAFYAYLRCNPFGGQGYDPPPGWEEYVAKHPDACLYRPPPPLRRRPLGYFKLKELIGIPCCCEKHGSHLVDWRDRLSLTLLFGWGWWNAKEAARIAAERPAIGPRKQLVEAAG
jgi:putative component of membrane protein insertase Oxa1/YidC/SpoIIIJ protein YidD